MKFYDIISIIKNLIKITQKQYLLLLQNLHSISIQIFEFCAQFEFSLQIEIYFKSYVSMFVEYFNFLAWVYLNQGWNCSM